MTHPGGKTSPESHRRYNQSAKGQYRNDRHAPMKRVVENLRRIKERRGWKVAQLDRLRAEMKERDPLGFGRAGYH